MSHGVTGCSPLPVPLVFCTCLSSPPSLPVWCSEGGIRYHKCHLRVFFLGTFSAPWTALAHSREQYCLAWEAKYLMELGNALETILSGLANMVAQEALKYTVLSGKPSSLPPAAQWYLILACPWPPRSQAPSGRWRPCPHSVRGLWSLGEETSQQPIT